MKESFNICRKLATVWAVVISMTACSKVGFEPTDPEAVSNGEMEKTETFLFNKNDLTAKVDILIVDDNSDSMVNAQSKLGDRLSSFITSLGSIDWQIGITTTDISDGPFSTKGSLVPFDATGLKILNKNVPNYEAKFANTIVRQETLDCADTRTNCPSSDERPMAAIMMALAKRFTDNKGFFRANADLVVIVLTNEDEASNGLDPLAMKASNVVTAFRTAFGNLKSFTGFGILVRPGDTACINQQAAYAGKVGTIVAQLADLTGGENGSICDTDYGATLDSIGNRVRDGLKSVTLKYTPTYPDEVVVTITPADPTLTWDLEGRQIIFNKPPAQFTRIDVSYKH